MAGFKAHAVAGISVSTVLAIIFVSMGIIAMETGSLIVFIFIGVFFSLFPDADTDSISGRLFYRCLIIIDLGLLMQEQYVWAARLGFFGLLPAACRHRGWTHSLWGLFLIPLIIVPFMMHHRNGGAPWPYYLAAFCGYAVHLILDLPVFRFNKIRKR